jgi:hypothetical protein
MCAMTDRIARQDVPTRVGIDAVTVQHEPSPNGAERHEPERHDPGEQQITWLTAQEAAEACGVTAGAVRKWVRRGLVRSRPAEGPRGERVEVAAEDVQSRADLLAAERPPASTAAMPDGLLPVPLDEWAKVLSSVAHLHEAGQQLAEARERAAKAETEAAFLRERLAELRQTAERDREEAAALRARVLDTPPAEPAPAKPAPRRRRWWGGRA